MKDANSTLDSELGELVRLYRLSAGLSQVELGQSAGISYQQIQKYESGSNKVSVSRLFDVASALGVSPSDVLAELEGRIEYSSARTTPMPMAALQFLATRRGQQIIRALADCEDPRLLEAFVDLFLAATSAERSKTSEAEICHGISLQN